MKLILILMIMLFSNLSYAENRESLSTGNDFKNICAETIQVAKRHKPIDEIKGDINFGRCIGFNTGFRKGIAFLELAAKKPAICDEGKITNAQSILVVSKYLDDHPEELHKDIGVTFLNALSQAFPCKK